MRHFRPLQLFRLALSSTLLFGAVCVYPQTRESEADDSPARGSLQEINDKRRAYILVIRSKVIDASDNARGASEAVKAGDRTEIRYRRVFNIIAKELNKYMRKHGSMTAAQDSFNADYVIVFNVTHYRRILDSIYPFGELFVIANQPSGETRVLWRTEKSMLPHDAIKKLVQAMKQVRGER